MITPQEFVLRWRDTHINTQIARLAAKDNDFDDFDLWGCSPLVRYESAVVNSLPLSKAVRHFLCEAGLPGRIFSWRLNYLPKTLLPLTEAVEGYTFSEDCARYRVLGVQLVDASWGEEVCFSFLCLDLKSGGSIVNMQWVDNKDNEVQFLNSSVPQFAEYVLLFRSFLEWCLTHHPYPLSEPNNEDILQHAQQVIQQMQRIDPQVGQHDWQNRLWEMQGSLI